MQTACSTRATSGSRVQAHSTRDATNANTNASNADTNANTNT